MAVSSSSGAVAERYEYNGFGAVSMYNASYNPIEYSAIGNTYLFTGNGYVKFSMPTPTPWALTKNITAGNNAAMSFTGRGRNDKVLEVTQEGMYPPDNLVAFTLSNGKAEMGNEARISPLGLNTKITLSNARITSTTGTRNSHRGLTLFGQPDVKITQSTFENGKYGIYAFLTYGGAHHLIIVESTFQNCTYGLWTHDKGVVLSDIELNTLYLLL